MGARARAQEQDRHGLTNGIGLLFKKNKVKWVKGTGRLVGKGGSSHPPKAPAENQTGKEIIVATGSASAERAGDRLRQEAASST